MMGIPKENIFELFDASHAQMVETESKLCDKISAGGVKLSGPTGIGTTENKFRGGIQWKILREIVFNLIKDGTIKVIEDAEGDKKVDLSDLKSIKVGVF